MNHPDDDYDLVEDEDLLELQHQDELRGSFLWGLAIGFLAGGLISLLVNLIL